ncbi:MAG TPA: leucine--tRNA ligase, partial [Candidatus Pacearchaeota archaeon]|nr:leucine--tRNA ligase [Candidatus Pacearchaeota archaeon]
YGSGMVMAVPAHDQRDYLFAEKYNIPIREVVRKEVAGRRSQVAGDFEVAYTGEGLLCNSGEFDGVDNIKAKEKITNWLIKKKLGKQVVNYKLRDWGFSRQRYWGTPIPIVNCEKCGAVPVPEKDLPVVLPEDVKFGKGNPLETNEEWLNVKCPKCGGKGRREAETMDTFFDSSWYFLRYPDNKNDKAPFDKKILKKWLPVDQYIGGTEHACLHLIYARFFTKVLRDLGFLDFDEPFMKLFNQGMLHGPDGDKMSKSKGNVINPDEISKKYGMDTARFFLLSLAAPDKERDWSEKGIAGSLRFIRKIFDSFDKVKVGKSSKEFESMLHSVVKDVSQYYDEFGYRKATIRLKELFDFLAEQDEVAKKDLEIALKLLSPICPHIAEELWSKIGNKDFISVSEWPEFDEKKILEKGVIVGDLNEKIIARIKGIMKDDTDKIYVYVMPFELVKVDALKIGEAVGREVVIFAVNDSEKVDPKGVAKRTKPGMAAIYLE